jgi:RNA polymerase sigma factor (TIGR02999 family)
VSDSVGEITRLLNEAQSGNRGALDEVMNLVYADLRKVARNQLHHRYGDQAHAVSLQPTALVNEAFLRLVKQRKKYDSRGHFFAIASRVMLRVLMDYHRSRQSDKRGGNQVRVSLSGAARAVGEEPSANIPAFVEAMKKLEKLDQRTADVTKLRLLWGLTVPEIAETLDLSVSTVEREWRFARRWLSAALTGSTDDKLRA